MSIWVPNLDGRTGPLYQSIVEALASDIGDGRLPPGSRLPPQRDLAWRLKVTVGTVARAYAEAARRRLVSGEVGRGTYVLDPEEERDGLAVLHRTLERIHQRPPDATGFVDMSINRPAGDNAAPAVAAAFRRLAESPDLARLLGYRIDSPWPRHAAAAVQWLAQDGLEVTPEQVTITTGAQQAIVAVMAGLTRPGDVVLTEELTYPGIKRTASLIDRAVEGVAMDDHGLSPEALDAALAKRPGSLVYCMPTLQNPTAVTMPPERRRAIVAVAQRHQAILVEDGIYAFLDATAPPPIWTQMPERCIYLTSLSKALSPGLRIGFVVAPEAMRTRIAAAVAATTMMVPAAMAEIAAMLIEDGTAARAAAAQRAEASRRIEIARAILGAENCPASPSDNLWVHLPPPWRADAFALEASRRGALISSATAFATSRRIPEAVRVSISSPQDHDQLRRGLEIVRRLMRDVPESGCTTV